jgi:hypothetical protein
MPIYCKEAVQFTEEFPLFSLKCPKKIDCLKFNQKNSLYMLDHSECFFYNPFTKKWESVMPRSPEIIHSVSRKLINDFIQRTVEKNENLF